MSAGGSTKVILISLLANAGVAVAKFAASLYTGSATMMAEAVHSLSDCGNQILLLHGQRAARKEQSSQYPMGRSMEMFFWSFVVALLLFSMGGLFSLYEGFEKLHHPAPLTSPHVAIAVLMAAIALESYSFWACYKEVRLQNQYRSLQEWIRKTNNTDLLVIFLEDFAALMGLGIALVCLLVSWLGNMPRFDAVGSLAIGFLLIFVALLLAREVKPLLIGESPGLDYSISVREVLAQLDPSMKLLRIIALQRGIGSIMLAYKLHPGGQQDVPTTIALVNKLEASLRARHPEIKWQFAELDTTDA